MADFSINVKIGGVEKSISTIAELEAALRATKEELKNVAIGSQAFEELGQQAANVQREIQNSFKEVVNFDKSIGQLVESVSRIGSTITAGFSIATSAFTLFGDESEALSQAQIKAQAALSLALGATTLATNAKKLAEDLENISAALGLQITKEKITATNIETASVEANTIATEANVAATEAEVIATETATVATRGFTAALLSNPLTAILVGLTAVIGALALFSGEEEKATEVVAKSNDELDRQLEYLKNQADFRTNLTELRTKLASIDSKSEAEKIKIELDGAREIKKITDVNIAQRRVLLTQKQEELATELALSKTRQIGNFFFTEEDKKNYEANLKAYNETTKALSDLETQSISAEVKLKEAEANLTNFNTKATGDRVKSFKEYQQALDNFLNKLKASNSDLNRQIEKIKLDQIALDTDIVGTLTENIEKLKVERRNDLADAQSTYTADLNAFRTTAKEKNISKSKIKEGEKLIEEEYNRSILLINGKYNDLLVGAEKDKADKIKLIDDVLKRELSFGDNNLYDSRKKLSAEQIQFELDAAKRKIEEEKALENLNVQSLIKSASDKDKKILDLTKQSLRAQADAEIEILRNQEAQAISQVQGTEEQKAIAIEGIKDQYRQKEKEINEKFRQEEFDAEIALAKRIRDERIALAQNIVQTAQQLVGALETINNEYQKLQSDRQAQAINDIYDQAQAQVDAQKAALDAGLINQEQYDANIAQIQKEANDRKIVEDDKYAEQAFKTQKRLALASAAVQIAQSILQALGNLPPPFSYISAGISAAAGAVQLGLIASQQYRSNENRTSAVTLPTVTTAATNAGGSQIAQASTGGLTNFNQALVGSPGGSFRTAGGVTPSGSQRVYVVESDITSAQRRVRVLENNSTFG